MQTIYLDNISIKEQILSDMINFVRIFSVVIVVLSVVLVTIQVCENAKRDFKLKNIFRFMDDKRFNKKTKKEIKHLKDFKVHYFDTKNKEILNPSESRHIHTLVPLPLPVHLPIPKHPREHMIENQLLPPSPPQQAFPIIHPDHLSLQHNSFFHDPYLAHFHQHQQHSHQLSDQNRQLISEASSPMISPVPPPILIHQEFNPFHIPLTEQIEERIAYPVFQLISNEQIEEITNPLHPNFFGGIDGSIRTKLDDNYKNNRKNDNNKQRNPKKENKNIENSVQLVNTEKFNTIHNINTNSDKFFDQQNSDSRKYSKTDKSFTNFDEKQNEREDRRKYSNDLRPSPNKLDEKIYSEPVPNEQMINIVEDEWTFKDLDLWIIR